MLPSHIKVHRAFRKIYFISRARVGVFTLILMLSTNAAIHAQNSGTITVQADLPRLVVTNSEQVSDSTAAPVTDPLAILRAAKLIYVRKKSVYFKAPELENELRKRPEFQRWGMAITRNEGDADLIIEVGRKVFTTRFVYTVIDPRTDVHNWQAKFTRRHPLYKNSQALHRATAAGTPVSGNRWSVNFANHEKVSVRFKFQVSAFNLHLPPAPLRGIQ